MIKTVFSRVMWVGRATVFTVGLAVTLALMLGVATVALAAVPGDPFKLGKTNTINRLTALVGSTAGAMLKVDNNGTGTALDLRVEPGNAPMKVNSNARVTNLNADQLDGKDSTDFAAYERTVMVSPVPGNPSASGDALRDALAGITDASSSNGYLLKIEPGKFDLGSADAPLKMKPFVDIEGSGEGRTLLTASGSAGFETATLVGADDAELRALSVENTGGATRATAIRDDGFSSLRLLHITARASGGTYNVGVYTLNASPRITDVTVSVGSGTSNYGLLNNNSSPDMTRVTATASGGDYNCSVCNRNSSAPTMTDVMATASGGGLNNGVSNYDSSPTMTNVTATASGGSNNYGIVNYDSSTVIHDSTVRASGPSDNRALTNVGGVVQINNSRLLTPPAGITVFAGPSGATTQVGASLLSGGATNSLGGTLTCAGVYDENYTFYASTCPQ